MLSRDSQHCTSLSSQQRLRHSELSVNYGQPSRCFPHRCYRCAQSRTSSSFFALQCRKVIPCGFSLRHFISTSFSSSCSPIFLYQNIVSRLVSLTSQNNTLSTAFLPPDSLNGKFMQHSLPHLRHLGHSAVIPLMRLHLFDTIMVTWPRFSRSWTFSIVLSHISIAATLLHGLHLLSHASRSISAPPQTLCRTNTLPWTLFTPWISVA